MNKRRVLTEARKKAVIAELVEVFQRIDDRCRDGELTYEEMDAARNVEGDKILAQYGEDIGGYLNCEATAAHFDRSLRTFKWLRGLWEHLDKRTPEEAAGQAAMVASIIDEFERHGVPVVSAESEPDHGTIH